jgi:hypothetical protein
MKRFIFALLIALLAVSVPAHAVTALWDHSDTVSVTKYRIGWGTVSGTYTFSQEMDKSACVAGVDSTTGPYDCKLILNGSFAVGTTYYFVGWAMNYDLEGKEQISPPTPVVQFIMRDPGQVGPKPNPMTGLGIYDR